MLPTSSKLASTLATKARVLDFPKSCTDLNSIPKTYEDFVTRLGKSYPGYNDQEYMNWLTLVRSAPSITDKVNEVHYSEEHLETWKTIYEPLRALQYQYACKEHLKNLHELESLGIISSDEVPNFIKINKHLKRKTGFKLVNVGGMINPRSFLYGLAFGIFYSTQYIRHRSVPFYSPEPDIVHEANGTCTDACEQAVRRVLQKTWPNGFRSE